MPAPRATCAHDGRSDLNAEPAGGRNRGDTNICGAQAPEGFKTLHVHDLRHTVGRRLRAAGVAHETRQAILGHKNGSVTTHYSAAELRELLEAMEYIATDNSRESHALTLLKGKAG